MEARTRQHMNDGVRAVRNQQRDSDSESIVAIVSHVTVQQNKTKQNKIL
jgi:hypothetical protein